MYDQGDKKDILDTANYVGPLDPPENIFHHLLINYTIERLIALIAQLNSRIRILIQTHIQYNPPDAGITNLELFDSPRCSSALYVREDTDDRSFNVTMRTMGETRPLP